MTLQQAAGNYQVKIVSLTNKWRCSIIMENRAKIKMNELKLKALVNLLVKEGILTHEEVEEELRKLLEDKDD